MLSTHVVEAQSNYITCPKTQMTSYGMSLLICEGRCVGIILWCVGVQGAVILHAVNSVHDELCG